MIAKYILAGLGAAAAVAVAAGIVAIIAVIDPVPGGEVAAA